MSLKIIFREFNEDEDGLKFYVSDSPLDLEDLPSPLDETGPSDTLTDESAEHGGDSVSHTVPWDITEQAYVKVVAHRNGSEVASQQWEYEPEEEGPGGTYADGSTIDGLTFAAMEAAGNYDSSTDTGFFGEVPASTLFTGPEIKSELDITEGTGINDEEPWLKFWSKDKVLYVNKKPIQRSISRDHIDSRGAVFGAEVAKNGAVFKARLLTGAASDPIDTSNQGDTDSCTYGLGAGSEWNELMYRVHSDEPFCGDPEHEERHGGPQVGENWASYSDSDLGITGAGRWNWTQETPSGATSDGIRRGGTDSVAHFNHTISDRSWSEFGLRLVLELVSEP